MKNETQDIQIEKIVFPDPNLDPTVYERKVARVDEYGNTYYEKETVDRDDLVRKIKEGIEAQVLLDVINKLK